MKATNIALPAIVSVLLSGLVAIEPARADDLPKPPPTFASRQALNEHYHGLVRAIERQQIIDLAALAGHETGAAADDAYRDLFHQAIARSFVIEASPAAERYLAGASTSSEIRSLAFLVCSAALVDQGEPDRALARLHTFLSESARDDQHRRVIVGPGDQLVQRLMRPGRYDLARSACTTLIADGHDREVVAHFENLLRPLNLVGKPAPAIGGADVDGMAFDAASLKGKVVLLVFWATWCPPCLADLPTLNAIAAKYQARGFEVVGVNVDGLHEVLKDAPATLHNVRRVLVEESVTWPNIYVEEGKRSLPEAFGVADIPANFLIRRDGTIAGFQLAAPSLDAMIVKELGRPAR